MTFTEIIAPLITLVVLEIILGIDNVIFISILSEKVELEKRKKLRIYGLGLAMVMRLLLLTAVSWIMKLESTLFSVLDTDISGKDLILLIGGLFLLYKSTHEIYNKTESDENNNSGKQAKKAAFNELLIQIMLLDIVFSIDSIITAVGMVETLWVMYTAVIISVGIMMLASGAISNFIQKHPSFKILALSFLMVIGISLIGEGLDMHIPKGYIYFAMAFSFVVDLLQMKATPAKKQ